MNKEIKQKRSKSFDMRFWWLVDQTEQGLFRTYWAPGYISLGDYFTKKHPELHHKLLRPIYTFEEGKSPDSLQGCVEILKAALKPSNPKVTGGQDDSLTRQDYSLHPGRLQAGWQGSIHKIQTSLANNKYLQQLRQRIPRM